MLTTLFIIWVTGFAITETVTITKHVNEPAELTTDQTDNIKDATVYSLSWPYTVPKTIYNKGDNDD